MLVLRLLAKGIGVEEEEQGHGGCADDQNDRADEQDRHGRVRRFASAGEAMMAKPSRRLIDGLTLRSEAFPTERQRSDGSHRPLIGKLLCIFDEPAEAVAVDADHPGLADRQRSATSHVGLLAGFRHSRTSRLAAGVKGARWKRHAEAAAALLMVRRTKLPTDRLRRWMGWGLAILYAIRAIRRRGRRFRPAEARLARNARRVRQERPPLPAVDADRR